MGLFKPKIYLPSSLSDSEKEFVTLHEMCHVRRFDHVTRILGFVALTIHWFNPLVWIAFIVSGRDMEMSCDEAVMKKMDTDIRTEYSQSLLRFGTSKKMIHATPLAFGEGDTKNRVKNVLNYKKPAFWVIAVTALACIVAVFCLVSNPKSKMPPTLYAYSEYGVIPMEFGTYSWNGVVSDAIPYIDRDYIDFISYNEGVGHRNANIFFSTSNKPSNFNSDNAKGIDDFKIVEMKRYVNGKEEVLSEFDGNFIEVSLELDTTYLYEFKVQFGENYAYYSMKINNNVTNSADKVLSFNFPIPEFGTKISEAVNLEKGYESVSLRDVTREQAESYIKVLGDNGWTAVGDFNKETTVGGLYEKGIHAVSVQFVDDLLTLYFSKTESSPDTTASAEYTMMKLGKNGEVLSSYSLKGKELADAILLDALSKSAAWEGVDVSTLEECYLIRQSFTETGEIHDYYAYRLADGTSVLQGGTNGRYSALSGDLYLQLVDSFKSNYYMFFWAKPDEPPQYIGDTAANVWLKSFMNEQTPAESRISDYTITDVTVIASEPKKGAKWEDMAYQYVVKVTYNITTATEQYLAVDDGIAGKGSFQGLFRELCVKVNVGDGGGFQIVSAATNR